MKTKLNRKTLVAQVKDADRNLSTIQAQLDTLENVVFYEHTLEDIKYIIRQMSDKKLAAQFSSDTARQELTNIRKEFERVLRDLTSAFKSAAEIKKVVDKKEYAAYTMLSKAELVLDNFDNPLKLKSRKGGKVGGAYRGRL